MNTKKLFLQIAGLTLTLCLLAGCGSSAAAPTATPVPSSSAPADFTGHWEDPAFAFSLDLSQNAGQLQGKHSVIAQNGNKIDALDNSIKGNIQADKATVSFQSSFASDLGTAQITFIDANTIYWKIITPPSGEYYLPAQATLIKKSSALNSAPVATASGTGTITGRVHLVGPPTPNMVVYAVDSTTGAWAFAETQATDGEAPFSIIVPMGTYQVFAAVASDPSIGVGYTLDNATLATITVTANQTASGIEVRPPSQSECGATMGYPASPDGRFTGRPAPSAECIATIQAGSTSPQMSVTRIQFNPNTTFWQTPGDLAPNASIRFVINAQKGQPMDVELTLPDTGAGPAASLNIWGADGQLLTPDLTTKWKGVLITTQDYYIELRSLSPQPINYSLIVSIPAIGSTPYVPVTLDVCQTLQRMAADALGVPFTLTATAPFTDPVTGETGRGCDLTATGTGINFSDPNQVTSSLANKFGFTEQPAYRADGPTGAAIGATRDMALALISAQWTPSSDANCPANQPISSCNLTPEQKLYTITIHAAMK